MSMHGKEFITQVVPSALITSNRVKQDKLMAAQEHSKVNTARLIHILFTISMALVAYFLEIETINGCMLWLMVVWPTSLIFNIAAVRHFTKMHEKTALLVDTRNAACSIPEDKQMIHEKVEQHGGFDRLDRAISELRLNFKFALQRKSRLVDSISMWKARMWNAYLAMLALLAISVLLWVVSFAIDLGVQLCFQVLIGSVLLCGLRVCPVISTNPGCSW